MKQEIRHYEGGTVPIPPYRTALVMMMQSCPWIVTPEERKAAG